MVDYKNYAIKERRPDGTTSVMASVEGEDIMDALVNSMMIVQHCYARAHAEHLVSKARSQFFAEPIEAQPPCGE